MADMVIRQVTEGLWTFSRPFARFNIVPVGGRSTAIKLRSGGVWVLASTPLTDEGKATLAELGPVKYICGGDALHWLFIGEFKKAYPEAKVYTVAEAAAKLPSDIKLDGVWGRDPPETRYEFENEITPVYFSGHRSKEVAYFHADSKTLIEADLLFNLPANEQYSKTHLPWFSGGALNPYSWYHAQLVVNGAAIDRDAMVRDVKKVSEFDFDRIIPCHGDVIEKDGKKAWMYAFKAFLQ